MALSAPVLFTRHYQHKYEKDVIATVVTITALALVLGCLAILPVDIFLVSSTVNPTSGLKYDWATPEAVDQMKDAVQLVYYLCYGCITFFCFFLIPFAYFYFEEEDIDINHGERIKNAFKYTSFFVLISLFLLLFAVFIKPDRPPPEWDLDWFKAILQETMAEKTLTFVVACLGVMGMFIFVGYTAPGLSLLPIAMIKGKRGLEEEEEDVNDQLVVIREHQRILQSKYSGTNKVMTTHDYRSMENLEDQERILLRRRQSIEEDQRGLWKRISRFFRPLEAAIGTLGLILSLVIVFSMFLTIVDKVSSSLCGSQCGYIITHPKLFNPVNFIFVNLSKLFPLDYVFMVILILYFFMATISGLVNIGIRFLWLNLYKIRQGGTAPQGLLVMTVFLTLNLLALNYVVSTTVVPGYAHFGSQVYCNYTIGDRRDCSDHQEAILPCDLQAPIDICTPTASSILIDRVGIDTPFLGLLFYYLQWAFLVVFLLGGLVSLCKRPRNNAEAAEDLEEEQRLLGSTSA
ncbi:hypothetical protein DM01DRAFT_345981 [Hesseltinella vesiculosa]|uniref:Probable lysosomal cobalamin transporter n=1 Tax=Hesseltinella vesiculosa TaxID=101127 RepID=A0A1X2GW06_9FUNG|nr:hypothetical protein DM01DRAFT_345981 [Hesseltinella vesiculosa]